MNVDWVRQLGRRTRAVSVLVVALAAASCSDRSPLGPIAPGSARLSLAPRFATVAGAPAVPLSRIDASLSRSGADPIRATANFVDGAASLTFDAPVFGQSTDYVLELVGLDVDGTEAYRGQQTYALKPGLNDNLEQPVLEYSAPDAKVAALHLTAGATTLDPGGTTRITVTGTDASNAPISPIRVGWTSRNTSIATVDDAGNIVASQLKGQTYVVARTPANLADSVLVVTRGAIAQVVATPSSISVLRGATATVTAEVRDPSGTLISDRAPTFSSTDEKIATVAPTGAVTGVAVGSATINATVGGKTASATVTVTSSVAEIQVDAPTVTLANIGDTRQLAATVIAKPGGSVTGLTPTFTSSDATVATVAPDGRVTAAGYGVATITATIESFTATSAISVVGPLAIAPATPTILTNTTQQLSVTAGGKGPFTYTVNGVAAGNATFGQVSTSGSYKAPSQVPTPASFDVCAIQASPATQGCTKVTIASSVAGIQLAPPTVTLANIGDAQQLTATITAKPGGSVAGVTPTFTTSDASVATAAADGRVTAAGYGIATITATIETFTATATVSVVGPLVLAPAAPTVFTNGATLQFSVTAGGKGPFTWTVNGVAGGNATFGTISASGSYKSPALAPTSGSSVDVCAVQTSPATQGCTKLTLASPIAGIQLAPPTVTLANIGDGQQLTATIVAKPGGSVTGMTATFATSNANVATVSADGRVTATGWGVATISANIETFAATTSVSVVAPLTISPNAADKLPNGTQQFQVLSGGNGPFTWIVNGVAGGNATFGTVSSSGFYVAPVAVPAPASFDVCATQALPQTSGCATVSIHAVPPAGTDVVVFNDVNIFDETGLADVNNQRLVNNLVSYTGPGPRSTQTGVMMYIGHGALFAPTTALIQTYMQGYTLSTVSTTLTSIPANYKVLFLWTPTLAFTTAEINVLKQFSADGGRIVFIGEHGDVYGAGILIENNFLLSMGAQMTNTGGRYDCAGEDGFPNYPVLPATRLTTSHQVMTGLTQLTVACASEIIPGPNDFVLFRSFDGNHVLSGVAKIDVTPLQEGSSRIRATPRVNIAPSSATAKVDAAGRPLPKSTP